MKKDVVVTRRRIRTSVQAGERGWVGWNVGAGSRLIYLEHICWWFIYIYRGAKSYALQSRTVFLWVLWGGESSNGGLQEYLDGSEVFTLESSHPPLRIADCDYPEDQTVYSSPLRPFPRPSVCFVGSV